MAGISAILPTTFFPASTMAKMKHWVENRDFHTFILTISSTGCQAPQLKFSLTIHGLGWIIFEFQVKCIHFSLTSSLTFHTFVQQFFPLPHSVSLTFKSKILFRVTAMIQNICGHSKHLYPVLIFLL